MIETDLSEIAAFGLWKSPGKARNRSHDVEQMPVTGATPLPAGESLAPKLRRT
jgi:hypothetical protein